MNPVLALALVAAAGIAVARLPRHPVQQLLHYDLVASASIPLLLLGVLLGPGIGVLEAPVLRTLAPFTALAIGWIGAVFGSRFEWRFVRRIPPTAWGIVLIQSICVFGVVAAAAWWLVRWRPELREAWGPNLPAILTLAAAATVSGPGAVALVARAAGVRRAVANAIALAAALDTAFGALGFTFALALYHPNQPVLGVVLAWYEWLILAVGSGLLTGVLFVWLARGERDHDLGLPLLGVILLGAGVGYAADLSPFVVCAIAATVIVNLSAQHRRVQQALRAWEHPIYAIFLIIAGALLEIPTRWIFVAAPLLAALRVLGKWAPVRWARGPLRATFLPMNSGFATVTQGGVALALAINFHITYGAVTPGSAVLTTIVLGMALAQLAAPPLMARALRATPRPHAALEPA